MGKRGYKLQEFVAHSGDVNCVRIGKKACRLLLTGGDDNIVKLWSIGKPNSLMSLCGHTTPVESVSFNSTELLVLGGAASGTVKLWDLEEGKLVRTLTGHRSNCTSVEFHPFGEFFASGSADTDLRIWDIRKRRCLFTYKGHNLGVNTIKFSPDGKWVVSGGFDNVVKVWDLTAGKLLHDLKFHAGHVSSIDFHPVEFLLATGSTDRTVKFWDLETFEMIESTKPELCQAKGVRAMAFHPDGKTLFAGYDNNLKVYSWEPVICHDAIEMGWSRLSDLCINEARLIGCSYYRNSIGVWVADISRPESYGTSNSVSPQDLSTVESKLDKSSSVSRSPSPDKDAKDIKNIYVDYEKPVSSRSTGFLNRSNSVSSSDSNQTSKFSARKQSNPIITRGKDIDQAGRCFFARNLIPRESYSSISSTNRRRESVTPARPEFGESIKVANMVSKLNSGFGVDEVDQISFARLVSEDRSKEVAEDKYPTTEKVENKFPENVSPEEPCTLKTVEIAHGKTRSLVEKFERKEHITSREDPIISVIPEVIADRIERSTLKEEPRVSGRELAWIKEANVIQDLMQNHDVLLTNLRSRLSRLQMVRHFWERNDIKGAVNALQKLSDHSVQADVIGALAEKMDIVSMDLFSIMLPVLEGLLDSKLERHAKISLELLLKLVAQFGPTIRSTISAPLPVGLDLHREERIECCKQCFAQLHQIKGFLPVLARRGVSLAKSAMELNLILQDHNI